MRPDKTDKHSLNRKLHHRNQPVIVPLDIKHIMLVSHTIHTPKHLLHVCKTCPFRLLHPLVPILKGDLRIRMLRIIVYQLNT